ncbi:MAG: hypothetical protein J0L96_18095 [Anaerolineae bacterium]|nr:hypothetical protein [Anaerolineae bacterium]
MKKLVLSIIFLLSISACFADEKSKTAKIIISTSPPTKVIIHASPTPTAQSNKTETFTSTVIPYPDAPRLTELLLTVNDITDSEISDWDFVSGIHEAFIKEEVLYLKDKSYDLKKDCLIECSKQIWGASRRYLEIQMFRLQDEHDASEKAAELYNSLEPYGYEYGIDEYKWVNAPTQNTHIGFSNWNKGYILTTSKGEIAIMIISFPSPYSDDGLHEVSITVAFANIQIYKLTKGNIIP